MYLIEILHQTTTIGRLRFIRARCILSKFYIKPQRAWWSVFYGYSCILSKFYIKPQLQQAAYDFVNVVSYRNSTSNHNKWEYPRRHPGLYLIEILHQTTTQSDEYQAGTSCILSKFYIKPQLRLERELAHCSCILSKFYIKPQRAWRSVFYGYVVSYRNSTSNHNHIDTVRVDYMLYLIEILHQTTTQRQQHLRRPSCILSKFYIKPQLRTPFRCLAFPLYLIEILHQTTTSTPVKGKKRALYLIEILHQTTTARRAGRALALLYLIEILHQTTTRPLCSDS